jgi:hypothetical protein
MDCGNRARYRPLSHIRFLNSSNYLPINALQVSEVGSFPTASAHLPDHTSSGDTLAPTKQFSHHLSGWPMVLTFLGGSTEVPLFGALTFLPLPCTGSTIDAGKLFP